MIRINQSYGINHYDAITGANIEQLEQIHADQHAG